MNYINILCIIVFITQQCLGEHDWAEKTLQRLTTREKIGQLFMVATAANFNQTEEALASALFICPYRMDHEYIELLIRDYHIGGLIFLFKSTLSDFINARNHFQSISSIPLLIGQDGEWGLNMRLYDAIKFPHNLTLGAIQKRWLIHMMGYVLGQQCKAAGIHINFAPVVDINTNPENPVINDRSFGENKYTVASAACLFMQGLQDAGILACAKHFPGHGDTSVDSHLTLPYILHASQRLHEIELYPFKELIAHGIASVMMAHIVIPALDSKLDLPASLSPMIVTDLLKHTLDFNGLVITDGLGMNAITAAYSGAQAALKAFLAGNDIILCPIDVPGAVLLFEQALTTTIITEDDLNKRVLKILQAKERVVIDQDLCADCEYAYEIMNSPIGLSLKRMLYQEAITLVKNNGTLPLSTLNTSAVLQIGGQPQNAFLTKLNCNHIHYCSADPIPDILTTLSNDPAENIIIGIFDMNKFAHKNYGISQNTLDLVARLKALNKTIIIVLFGSPYALKLFEDVDALIMAYEDDPDAQEAAAKVLNGLLKPNGKLPITASSQFLEGCVLSYE